MIDTRILPLFVMFACFLEAKLEKTVYDFTLDPIDIIIPCHKKDARTINKVIEGIQQHIGHRSIIIISSERLSDQADWFDESLFPFTKKDVANEFFDTQEEVLKYLKHPNCRIGWIYQQLLKLYAPFVIPDISSNVLVIDADTIFLRSAVFQDEDGAPYFNTGTEYHAPYLAFMDKVIPGLKRVFPKKAGVCHHMLFQRCILEDLFTVIQDIHKEEPWKALLHCMEHPIRSESGMSEYELYFNFTFSRTDQAKIRQLKWKNLALRQLETVRNQGYDYVSCHSRIK